jgi:predicted NBD/HSP70 family sugar kinase
MSYIVFDIGGTKTRIGITNDLETLEQIKSFGTKKDFSAAMSLMIEEINKLVGESKLQGIAGGIRGVLNEEKSGIQKDPGGVLSNWEMKSVTDELSGYFKVPAILENDSAIAGLGEAVFGGGKELSIVAYHTISTGVGGVRVVDGLVDKACYGFEPGHQILDVDRTILGEDVKPTLENLVSGTALESRVGMKPYDIPQSDTIWNELAGYLAQGLRNTTLYWSPDVIVLGGSMIIGDPKILIEDIRKHTVEVLDGLVPCPYITAAKLGDEAGLYGAMAMLANSKN